MAIESAACFRRLARTGLSVLIGMSSVCGIATAQKQLVSTGSIIPLPHSNTYGQILTIDIAPNGDAIFLDVSTATGEIYQLKKGSTTFQTITPGISPSGDTYWNEGMAMDAKGTLYLTARYGSPYMYRVPYNAADGTYDFSASGDSWEATLDSGFEGNGTQNAYFLDNPAKDGSGTLFVSSQNGNNVLIIPVSADGTVPLFATGANAGQPQFQYLIKGLKDKVMPLIADVNGNVYMIENPYDPPASRATGIFFVPASAYKSCMAASAAGTTDPKVPCVSGTETSMTRIDPGNPEKYNGITLDAAGNIYVGSTTDSYGGAVSGLLEIPNESGSPIGVTATSFNFGDAQYLAPIAVNANPTIDPRGFIWLPEGGAGNFSPNGSGQIPNTGNFVLWQLGAANLGATPVGTPSATGTVFFTFSGSATPASLPFTQPGGNNDFSAVATNPYPPTAGTTPATPCGASTTATPPTYIAGGYCEYWVALTPQGANSVGDLSGQLSMLDASGNVISGSTAYLSGIGEGPAVSLLSPAQQTPLATGLVSPQQVAGDSFGNSYVADSGLGKVLKFAAGSTTASAGTSIGTGLTAPTGVTVDGVGDVYIADSGKVIEVPAVNGTLNPAGQVVLQSGLGNHLNLAVDNAQNVYVADTDNARVVRIYNPQMAMVIQGTKTVGTFTKPTAVAVDDSGNLYVADGANLDEINFWGGQSTITSNLSAPVTGLAVDPSNSVYVTQSGGILRIPLEATGLNFNDAGAIDGGGVTAPSGIAIDSLGNFYVTAPSYTASTIGSTGAGTSTVNTPSLLLLNGALVNFGLVSQQTQSNPIDVGVYNIGNAPLALTGVPTFSGANASDYSIQADGQNPCDTSEGTPVPSATSCQLGVTVTAAGLGLSQGSMAVPTNALNAPTTNAALEAYSSDLLCRTLTTITLNPSTGFVYPGSTTVTSTTVPDPAHPCPAGGSPQNGIIALTLAPQTKGAQPTTQNLKLTAGNGQQTFTLSALNGGTYAVYAAYKGDPVYGGSTSAKTFTFVVAPATPTIALNEPAGINPVNGTYYVLQGSTTTIQATVTSTVGKPTGSVQFLSGGKPVDTTQNPVTLSGSGTAILNTSNLALGTYTITAVYSSDVNFAAATSAAITIVVIQQSVLITANPASVTTKAGVPVTSTLTLTALEGYSPSMNVQLYCETATTPGFPAPGFGSQVNTVPHFAECTFDVPQVILVAPAGGTQVPQISHVTITTNIPTNESALRTNSPIAFAGLFGLSLLGMALRKKGKFGRSPLTLGCLMLVFAGIFAGFSGCTNSGYTHTPQSPVVSTPPGTYQVVIYAVDLSTGKISSLPFTLSVTIQ
ncbi:MAG TPA: Ig-like domain repeat protein [Acidobacteriaceae bacterium]